MFIISREYLVDNVIKYDENDIIAVIINKLIYYHEIKVLKKRGIRTIYTLEKNTNFYGMQKNLQKNFLSKVLLPTCVKGFCNETSYCDFLNEHVNKRYYMRMDIKDFFDSITSVQVHDSLQDLVKTEDAIDIIVKLCTYEGFLPQGAVTSPMLSNIVFRRIDQRILKYCQKFDITYTRYADDLLFSSNKIDFKSNKWFYKKIKYILQQNGFKSNYSKRHIEQDKLCLGGFVVKNEVTLSRKKLNNINKILYYFKDKSKKDRYVVDNKLVNEKCIQHINSLKILDNRGRPRLITGLPGLINYLCGYRSFLIEVINSNENINNKKIKNLQNKIKQIEKVVKQINLLLEK